MILPHSVSLEDADEKSLKDMSELVQKYISDNEELLGKVAFNLKANPSGDLFEKYS